MYWLQKYVFDAGLMAEFLKFNLKYGRNIPFSTSDGYFISVLLQKYTVKALCLWYIAVEVMC